ncbi:hypothetical protein KGF57_001126 [Candida theae]|uniref:Uncharacterized protein n=1 Tax=Candida theae TaxID=1198502 RepID=A0AAD5FZZ6_9ASCO|nr:uncharacterized protein KGF57_001126 [Candida theae]KAI5964015.1 hypothetical protein KGF57_001126 [Candida theae]
MRVLNSQIIERGRTPTREAPIQHDLRIAKGESKAQHSRQELLQQAVNYRSSLTRSLTRPSHDNSKQQSVHRPEYKRWSSYESPARSKDISPFTMIHDQYDTKRPTITTTTTTSTSTSSIYSTTDNSFKKLENSIPQPNFPKPSLYEKMTNFASDDDSLSDTTQQEGDDTQYEIESVESKDGQPNFEEVMQLALQSTEISTTPRLNRTQQKQLDLKNLYQDEHSGQLDLNYEWKIQNETIVSQYTMIRLRFASRQVHRKRIESSMGVLGYIKRHCQQVNSAPVSIGKNELVLRQIWDDANTIFQKE